MTSFTKSLSSLMSPVEAASGGFFPSSSRRCRTMLDCSKTSSTLDLRFGAIFSNFRITNPDTHSERQLRMNVAVTMTASKVMKKRGSPVFLQYAKSTHFAFKELQRYFSADEMGIFESSAKRLDLPLFGWTRSAGLNGERGRSPSPPLEGRGRAAHRLYSTDL